MFYIFNIFVAMMLFLDDIREPYMCLPHMEKNIWKYGVKPDIYLSKEWAIVRSYTQFVNWITTNGLPLILSFDHDLADNYELRKTLDIKEWFDMESGKEYTGMDCAHYLVNYCMDKNLALPKFVVHSQNPTGNENIHGLLTNFSRFQSNNKK